MRTCFTHLAVLFAVFAFMHAAVTNMNTPVSPILPGSVLTINWINDPGTGQNPKTVQLQMVSRTNGRIFPIDGNVDPNAGVYNWNMPKSIPEGDYYIRMMGGAQPLFTGNFHVNSADGKQSKPMSEEAVNTNEKSGDVTPGLTYNPSASDGGSPASTDSDNTSTDTTKKTSEGSLDTPGWALSIFASSFAWFAS